MGPLLTFSHFMITNVGQGGGQFTPTDSYYPRGTQGHISHSYHSEVVYFYLDPCTICTSGALFLVQHGHLLAWPSLCSPSHLTPVTLHFPCADARAPYVLSSLSERGDVLPGSRLVGGGSEEILIVISQANDLWSIFRLAAHMTWEREGHFHECAMRSFFSLPHQRHPPRSGRPRKALLWGWVNYFALDCSVQEACPASHTYPFCPLWENVGEWLNCLVMERSPPSLA